MLKHCTSLTLLLSLSLSAMQQNLKNYQVNRVRIYNGSNQLIPYAEAVINSPLLKTISSILPTHTHYRTIYCNDGNGLEIFSPIGHYELQHTKNSDHLTFVVRFAKKNYCKQEANEWEDEWEEEVQPLQTIPFNPATLLHFYIHSTGLVTMKAENSGSVAIKEEK